MFYSCVCVCVYQMDSFMSALGVDVFSSSTVQTSKSASSTCNGAPSSAAGSPSRTAASVSLSSLFILSHSHAVTGFGELP